MSIIHAIFWIPIIMLIVVSVYFLKKDKRNEFEKKKGQEDLIKLKNEFDQADILRNKELNVAVFEQKETLKQYMEEREKFNNTVSKYEETISRHEEEQRADYNKLLTQKKSSEVRVGKIGENMAPFLNGWPYDPNNFRFLGNPIDGVQFNEDELIFIEIKTGKSALSKKQRWIKQLIKDGKVGFATFRINEKGVVFTKEKI